MGLTDLKNIKIQDYTYDLPEERIAKYPLLERSASKLLIYRNGNISHTSFSKITELVEKNTLLVFNKTKVIYARLLFRKLTGATIEIFSLEPVKPADYAQSFSIHRESIWKCMVGNLKKWKGEILTLDVKVKNLNVQLRAERIQEQSGEAIQVHFTWDAPVSFGEILEACGEIPIPPYLNRKAEEADKKRYQTVYSKEEGSVAAPTAGLHFTEEIIDTLQQHGVESTELVLHVGAGTFRPVKSEEIGDHDMHTEHIIISHELVKKLAKGKRKVTAVGTTTVRTLESLYWMGVKLLEKKEDFSELGQWEAYTLPQTYPLQKSMNALLGWFETQNTNLLKAKTTIIIVPGYSFKVVNSMFTNFHQPQSTLLLLVGAAVGEDWRKIYQYALENDFRFLSYGDSSYLEIKS